MSFSTFDADGSPAVVDYKRRKLARLKSNGVFGWLTGRFLTAYYYDHSVHWFRGLILKERIWMRLPARLKKYPKFRVLHQVRFSNFHPGQAGNFMHQVFEEIDFSDSGQWEVVTIRALKKFGSIHNGGFLLF